MVLAGTLVLHIILRVRGRHVKAAVTGLKLVSEHVSHQLHLPGSPFVEKKGMRRSSTITRNRVRRMDAKLTALSAFAR